VRKRERAAVEVLVPSRDLVVLAADIAGGAGKLRIHEVNSGPAHDRQYNGAVEERRG
jgi:hypothetical protein